MRSGLRQGRILVVRPRVVNVAGSDPLDAWRSGAGHRAAGNAGHDLWVLPGGSLGAFAYALSYRVPLGLDVIRERKALFREHAGRIENMYTLKVLNMDERPHHYDLHPEKIPRLDLSTDGPIEAAAGAVVETPGAPDGGGVAPRVPQHARHVRPYRSRQ